MAANLAGSRYQTCYAVLLRLYPRPFRARFGEEMAQIFRDLCREHGDLQWRLFWVALSIYGETIVAIVRDHAK